ncbi:unnamed protein product [Rotaria magnacalcarata]
MQILGSTKIFSVSTPVHYATLCVSRGLNLDYEGQMSNDNAVFLFLMAHWCSPCRKFTPELVKIFDEVKDEINNKLDIVFISCDRDQESFDEYLRGMPWKALPFSDRNLPKLLGEKFNIDGIPSLVVLPPFLQIITLDGIDEVRDANKEALHKWSQGKRLFWTREPQDGEYVWKTANCTECFMMPMVVVRYSCTNVDCQIDLCEACLSKTKHKYPLVEYLIPKQQYSLEKILASIPYLLDPNNSDEIDIKNMWKSDIKSIGF